MTTAPIGFDKWDLEEPISRAIKERGWTEPTEIQIESVPHARKGRDIVGQARTGSGKTAAFGYQYWRSVKFLGKFRQLSYAQPESWPYRFPRSYRYYKGRRG